MRLIDADALIEELRDKLKEALGLESQDASGLQLAIDIVEDTVDAEPVRHGRWETHQKDSFAKASSSEKLRCSLCGHFYYHSFGDGKLFCPNCGVIMDGGVSNCD